MKDLSKKIDHTLLRADCTPQAVIKLCGEALEFGFKTVCIPPYYVKQAHNILEDSEIKVATVIGFPMGYSSTFSKVEEIKRAIDEGAEELDVVINIAAVKDGNWNYVKNDINSTTLAAHLKGKVVKIILETALLTAEEVEKLCVICTEYSVNFVKTSTGFNGGVDLETIKKLRALLPAEIKIKAWGGIRKKDQAMALIEAGADRLGSSAGVALISS